MNVEIEVDFRKCGTSQVVKLRVKIGRNLNLNGLQTNW